MTTCPHCEAAVSDVAIMCEVCNKPLGAAPRHHRKCRFCTKDIADASRACEHCGRDLMPHPAPLSAPPRRVSPRAMKAIAIVGGVGAIWYLAGVAPVIALAVVVGLVALATRGSRATGSSPSPGWYCPNCGNVAWPTTQTKGSFLIEVLLWLCFLVPGLIYSLWRLSSRSTVCPSCHAPNMIPAGSPRALAEQARLSAPTSPEPATKKPWVPRPHKDAVKVSALPIGDATHRDLGSGDGYALAVVGESYRQAALQDLSNGRLRNGVQVTFTASLIPEPDNPKDRHAIRVDIQDGAQVGYLSREDAQRYRPAFEVLTAHHLIGIARAKLIGGVTGKPSIGVMLDVNEPHVLLHALEHQPF